MLENLHWWLTDAHGEGVAVMLVFAVPLVVLAFLRPGLQNRLLKGGAGVAMAILAALVVFVFFRAPAQERQLEERWKAARKEQEARETRWAAASEALKRMESACGARIRAPLVNDPAFSLERLGAPDLRDIPQTSEGVYKLTFSVQFSEGTRLRKVLLYCFVEDSGRVVGMRSDI